MFLRNLLFLVACTILAFMASAQEGRVDCDPNNRIIACPAIYLPVCGWTYSGESATYSSGCDACADPNVQWYTPGECLNEGAGEEEFALEEEYVLEEENWAL